MPGSLRIGKIAGINIEVHASWLIIFALLTFSLAIGWFPYTVANLSVGLAIILGAIGALLLFISVLAHELAHSLVARRRGLPVKSITLFVFGGVSNIAREPSSPGVEFQMALVGPLTSLLIGALFWPLGRLIYANSPALGALLVYLGFTNVLLGAFNLIPGFPLDGGRVLRSIIWRVNGSLSVATRWAARIGEGVAYLFILAGIALFFVFGDLWNGLWIGFIGWFLLTAAHSETTQVELTSVLQGVTVGEIMLPAPESVPPTLSIQRLVDEHILPRGTRALPVVQVDLLVGWITLRDIQRVPRSAWSYTPVGQVMISRDAVHTAQRSQLVEEVLPLLISHDINQLPVVEDDGRLVGILSREAIVRRLEVRRSLGVREAPSTVQPEPPHPETQDHPERSEDEQREAEQPMPPAGTLSGSRG